MATQDASQYSLEEQADMLPDLVRLIHRLYFSRPDLYDEQKWQTLLDSVEYAKAKDMVETLLASKLE